MSIDGEKAHMLEWKKHGGSYPFNAWQLTSAAIKARLHRAFQSRYEGKKANGNLLGTK